MSCFFPGKDEPNARSRVQPRARRGSYPRKRSPVLRNVVILITTNPELLPNSAQVMGRKRSSNIAPCLGRVAWVECLKSAAYALESLTLWA